MSTTLQRSLTWMLVASTVLWAMGTALVSNFTFQAHAASAGDLIKMAGLSSVYYYGSDGRRYVFPNETTYWTWYSDFSMVKTISQSELESITIGGNVKYRAGTYMVKVTTDPKVYTIAPGGMLSHVPSEAAALKLFGPNWSKMVRDLPDAFFTNYSIGSALAGDKHPEGTLIQYTGNTNIYLIDKDGKKRLVTDMTAFNANRFQNKFIVTGFDQAVTYSDGTSLTGAESGLTDTAQLASGGGAPGGGNLTVALASDTPASGLVLSNQSRAPFTKVMLTAVGGDAVIDSWVVKREGIASDSSFSSIDIVDLSTNATINESGKTFSTDHTASFTEDLTVKSGETKYVMLVGNMAASPGSGEQPALTLWSVTLKSGAVSGTPVMGKTQTINTSITIGTATIQRGAYTNATSTTIEVGKKDYTFFSFQVQAGSAEDIDFNQVKVYQAGSASVSSDLANIKLYRDGTFLANGVASGNYINFSFPAELITKGQIKQYQVKADVVSGSARTVKLGIWRTTDLLVMGKTYNAGIVPTYSSTGSSANSPVMSDNQFTISVGTFRVGRSSTVAATNITVGPDQVLGAFEFEAKGEPIVITALTLTVASSSAAQIEDALRSVKLVDESGKVVAGPTDVTNNALTVAWTDTFTVPTGIHHYKVMGTLSSNGGWATNNTITVSFTPSSAVTAKGDSTGQSVTPTPSSSISASQQTVKAATLTVVKNSTPTNKSIITNSSGVLMGSWRMDATNAGEDVRITSLAIRASTTGKLNNLTLKDGTKALSPVNDAPTAGANVTSTFALSEPIVVAKGTSKDISLYGDVGSNANAGEVDAWGLTDVTSATNASVVAYGVSTGNRATVTLTADNGALLTIAAAGTLTITLDASVPSSRLVVHGSTGTVLSEVRLKATNEDVDITKLTVRVADGALTGTATGTFAQLMKVTLKLDGTVIGNASGYSLGQASNEVNFQRGQLTIPMGTTGKKLTILGDIVNIGTNEPGTANADIRVGLAGANGFTATGNGSNTAATETYTDSTGSAIILHKAAPSVVIETPANKLGATAVLHRVKISALQNTIGLYRLAYVTTTSTSVNLQNGYTKLVSCGSCGGVADGSQLADTVALGTDITPAATGGTKTWSMTIVPAQSHGKRHLDISAGGTATIDFYATVTLSTNADTVSTSLLGDTATSATNTFLGGSPAANFAVNRQGNFVWSDLNGDDSQAATSLTNSQWYNGYLVAGLGATTTSTPVSVGE